MAVTMFTVIEAESVVYTVRTGESLMEDFGNGREVWRKEVPFGMGERFRAGGAAFVAAAREQAEVADSYAFKVAEAKR